MSATKKAKQAGGDGNAGLSTTNTKLKWKDYQRELGKLHVELVKLQEWIVHNGHKVTVVFEGRDGAGKGGVIKAITERVSPRVFHVVALPAPSEREKSVEKAIIDSGIILLKYWLEGSEAEQTRRLRARIGDGRKVWKLSSMDLQSYSRWYDYSQARDDMFAATDTPWAPWFVLRSDDKRRARLNVISHLLRHIPYEEMPRKK